MFLKKYLNIRGQKFQLTIICNVLKDISFDRHNKWAWSVINCQSLSKVPVTKTCLYSVLSQYSALY